MRARRVEGSIEWRGRNSFRVRVPNGRDPATGRPRWLRRTGKGNRKAAEKALRDLLHEQEHGIAITPERITVREYLDRWLVDYAQANVSPRTLVGYRQTINVLTPFIGALLLRNLEPAHIQNAYAVLIAAGRANRTVAKHHTVLKEALKHAVRWTLLGRNPAEPVFPPRAEKTAMQTASFDALTRIYDACGDDDYLRFVHVAVQTGLRSGELLGLRWRDVSWETNVLHIRQARNRYEPSGFALPKGRKVRDVVIDDETIHVLRTHKAAQAARQLALGPAYRDHELAFPREDGTPESQDRQSARWRRLRDGVGLPGLRLHDMRHTMATQALEAGIPAKVVQERLGHSGIAVTLDTYTHVSYDLQRQAADTLAAALPKLPKRARFAS